MLLSFRAALLGCALLLPTLAVANEPEAGKAPAPVPTKHEAPAPVAAAPVVPVASGAAAQSAPRGQAPLNETQQYCQNIAAAAADARFAWQRKQLTDLQAQLKASVAELEARQAALQEALARRDEVMKRAADTVVGLYAKMKPDAAASQIAALDDVMASAILSQLNQRQASTILNEIPAERAAKLISVMAGPMHPEKKS